MAKKFYDIYPSNIKEQEIKLGERKSRIKMKSFSFKKWSISLILLFLILGFLKYTLYLRAEIIIFPKTEAVSYRGEVVIDSEIHEIDFDNNHIPGNIFELEKKRSEKFSASGEETEERRAEGILRVYNNHSESPLGLIIETRFISSGGNLFKSTERVNIPGRTQAGPGYADVRVRAVEAGENFNINETLKFSVPGLQGTAMYTSVYAENIEPITGGFVGRLPKILQQDIDNSRETIISDIVSSFKKELKENNPGILIIDDLINIEIIEENINPGVGENYDSFEIEIKLAIKAIYFNEDDLRNLIKKKLLDQSITEEIKENYFFTEKDVWDEFDLSYEVISKNQLRSTIKIDTSGLVYPQVNKDLLKEKISGKKVEEAIEFISSHPMVEKIDINIRPSWISKIPNPDKLIINLIVAR